MFVFAALRKIESTLEIVCLYRVFVVIMSVNRNEGTPSEFMDGFGPSPRVRSQGSRPLGFEMERSWRPGKSRSLDRIAELSINLVSSGAGIAVQQDAQTIFLTV
jgi:hypothetical protein